MLLIVVLILLSPFILILFLNIISEILQLMLDFNEKK